MTNTPRGHSRRVVKEVSEVVNLFHDLLGFAIEKRDADLTRAVLRLDLRTVGELIKPMRSEASGTYLRALKGPRGDSVQEWREVDTLHSKMRRLTELKRRCRDVGKFTTISYDELMVTSIPELLEIIAEHSAE
jgi:hypothetical protein